MDNFLVTAAEIIKKQHKNIKTPEIGYKNYEWTNWESQLPQNLWLGFMGLWEQIPLFSRHTQGSILNCQFSWIYTLILSL